MTEVTQDRKALEVLVGLTDALSEEKPLEDSLLAVTDAALAIISGDHSSIRLLDSSRTELLVGSRSGAGRDLPAMNFQMGEGLIGWVVANKSGVVVADTYEDVRFKRDVRTEGGPLTVRSLVAEPLWSGGHVIGVLSVSSPKTGAFTPFDQLLVRLLANCSAPPIERARLRRLAMTDDLTLAYNQRYLMPRAMEEMERSRRTQAPLSSLLLDLDHFKQVNDTYGHSIGDKVLRQFADRVRTTVRRIDVLIRRGGEEFVLLMPQSDAAAAHMTAERIRAAVGNVPFNLDDGIELHQTVSIGISTWTGSETVENFQARADAAMYRAKETGRNRVEVAANDEVLMHRSKRPPQGP